MLRTAQLSLSEVTQWTKQLDYCHKFVTPIQDGVERRSIFQSVQFFVWSKTHWCQYYLHKFSEKMLH